MTIEEVLTRADALYPNAYERSQKLCWCGDVSETLRQNVKRLYGELRFSWTGSFALPCDVSFSDVEYVYVNDRRADKTDERSFCGSSVKEGDKIRVVYLLHPDPCRLCLEGTFSGEGGKSGEMTIEKGEEAGALLLSPGETLSLSVGGSGYAAVVTNVSREPDGVVRLTVSGESLPEGVKSEAVAVSSEHTTAVTECGPPWDELYVDYVCAQIAFYQNDLYDYNKFSTLYNERLQGFANAYKHTAPLVSNKQFRNVW